MKILSGEIVVAGRLAYVPQQPWIVSASLRDNILLGNDLDQDRWVGAPSHLSAVSTPPLPTFLRSSGL